jgi:putative SOS response-associated peptidase YedK
MCGRYGTEITGEQLSLLLEISPEQCEGFEARYNIAPTQRAPVARLRGDGSRELVALKWGLVPGWSRDTTRAAQMINARSETVAEKPSFREAFESRRCLVVADGFYEWRRVGREKIPTHFQLLEGEAFAFAGLWESWRPPQGEPLETFTVLTTEANERVAPIHHRMPVMLMGEFFSHWLDPQATPAALQGLLRPFPAEGMESWEVSTRVNAVKNDDPACRFAQARLL